MAKRKYRKANSEYWNNLKRKSEPAPVATAQTEPKGFPTIQYKFDDSEHFSAVAACGGGSPRSYRDGFAPEVSPTDAYVNIDSQILPWETSNGRISISRAILLAQKAYAGVAVVRNTIESQVEFSNSKLHLKSSNKTAVDFFNAWFDTIGIFKLCEQFFRERYCSGNWFAYKMMGRIPESQTTKLKNAGLRAGLVPIRYYTLNPSQVYLQDGLGYSQGSWVKIMSTYEIDRLKNPQTDEDRQVFNSLPAETKSLIKKGGSVGELYIPLDPKRLRYVFYKKQDYQPMAIPMVYPVLNDIEWKLELKKMDMSLSRTIEQVLLLVTTGEPTSESGYGGINPENLANLREVFSNQTLGRVLVADYTTKAEWAIPDIGKILGPEKYTQVERDIKEGLQSILMGDDKFANAQIKAKVFIERMKEGQRAFLAEFLIPEMKQIAAELNIKNLPEVEFEEIDITDPSVMARIYLRMAEIGILTPDELNVALTSGVLPEKEMSVINQGTYKDERDKGLYKPLLGGQKEPGEGGRPQGTKAPQSTKRMTPQGTKGSITEDEKFSQAKFIKAIPLANELKDTVQAEICKKYKIAPDVLTVDQKGLIETIAKCIIVNEDSADWTPKTAKAYIKDPKIISEEIGNEIDAIAVTYDLANWNATLAYKCKV